MFALPESDSRNNGQHGFRGKYDQLILAGASLGVIHTPEWQTTFMEQLEVAIRKMAYRKYSFSITVTTRTIRRKRKAHIKICNQAIEAIRSRFSIEAIHCLFLTIEIV